jgi:opacity protein-like surface antigen
VGVVFGYQPLSYLAVEVRDLFTVSERVHVHDGQGALLVRGTIPIHPYFNVYGIAGTSVIFTSGFDDTDTDITYGIGLRFRNSSPLILDLEYQHLYEGNFQGVQRDMSAFNMNILYGF